MENFINHLQVYDVVTAPYHNTVGAIKTNPNTNDIQYGLFMVADVSYGNALCFKITSNSDYNNIACVTIKPSNHLFLRTTSYIQTNRIHTLDPRVCKKLGSISFDVRPLVLKTVTPTLTRIVEQLQNNCGQTYVSPNKKNKNKK